MSDDRTDDKGAADGESWLDRLIARFTARPRDPFDEDGDGAPTGLPPRDVSAAERAMLRNILGLNRVRVVDVMIPRADIAAVAQDTTLGELLILFRKAGHSRLPVYGESLDEPLGMVHIRDLMDFIADAATGTGPGIDPASGRPADLGRIDLSATLTASTILRPVIYVPGSMPVIELLVRMQASRTHMALVIDEFGGTDGLVSLEDLVETVVGDIEDEHDETASSVEREPSGALLVDARAYLEEVSAALGFDVATAAEAEDVDTLGGLIVTGLGRVPARGEVVPGPAGLVFEILDADRRRLKRVRVRRGQDEAVPDTSAAPAAGEEPPH